jgi:hypothetical protein
VLEEIAKSLDSFINSVSQFDDWYQQVWEILDSSDQEEADQLGARIEDISRQKDQRREDFDNMLQNGRTLVIKKDIADATPIREKIKSNLMMQLIRNNMYLTTFVFQHWKCNGRICRQSLIKVSRTARPELISSTPTRNCAIKFSSG